MPFLSPIIILKKTFQFAIFHVQKSIVKASTKERKLLRLVSTFLVGTENFLKLNMTEEKRGKQTLFF